MVYSKPLMSITELNRENGIPIRDLKMDVHVPGQTFARKTAGGGKWLIDVVEYEKFRLKRRKR